MLPSYEDVKLRFNEYMARPPGSLAPTKRPTKKGLGRYVAQLYRRAHFDIVTAEWWHIWMNDTRATTFMLKEFHIRLPADTFYYDKVRVSYLLSIFRHEDPQGYMQDPHARKADRWASK